MTYEKSKKKKKKVQNKAKRESKNNTNIPKIAKIKSFTTLG